MYNDSEKISANEINKYCYCQYSWYYGILYEQKNIRESYKTGKEFKYKTKQNQFKYKTKQNQFKYKAKNKENEFKYKTLENFKRGVAFHDDFLEKRKSILITRFIVLFIVLGFLTVLLLWILKLVNIW